MQNATGQRVTGVEPRPLDAGQPIEVPAGIAVCHVRYPRRFVERVMQTSVNGACCPSGGLSAEVSWRVVAAGAEPMSR